MTILDAAEQAENLISIHTLRMEGDAEVTDFMSFINISIHTLRMEGDQTYLLVGGYGSSISIHTLRMEGDSMTAQALW